MLAAIQVKNFALIENLNLDFSTGMTVITGETGAGKSIVIDALGLALGERADVSMVRAGSDKADITATFHFEVPSTTSAWLKDHELYEGNEVILRRVIAAEGRSKCFINGMSVTLSMLKELGDTLVDIHGQHAHQSLLKPNYQLQLLDQLLPTQNPIEAIKQCVGEYRKVTAQINQLTTDAQSRKEKLELLSYQYSELEALKISDESISQLEQDHAKATHTQELTEASERALATFFDADPAIFDIVNQHLRLFESLKEKDSSLASSFDLLAAIAANLEELKFELRHYQDSLEIDPDKFAEMDEQLSALFDIARKHHVEIAELPTVMAQIGDQLNQLNDVDANMDELNSKQSKLQKDYQALSQQLTQMRQQTAKQLETDVTEQMQHLGMKKGVFAIEVIPESEGLHSTGAETVEFKVTANPGQPLQPLGKVASGGELSRISLAIQVITAQQHTTPCLIFDEVDVGIGGQTADTVGQMLKNIAKHAQVICVTHQAQVAAKGDTHLSASKESDNASTQSKMIQLTTQARVEEIARMVGGQSITESTLTHAKELLGES